MAPSGMIKAIIFDMDGTLLDTETLSDKAVLLAFGKSLPESVFQESPMNEYKLPWEAKRQILGLRGKEWSPVILNYAKQKWGAEESSLPSPNEIWKGWEDHLGSMCEEVEACAGATKLVEELAKTGIPMGIATSSRYAGVDEKRKRHGQMFQHISVIVAGDDPAVNNGKPAPDIYLEAARRLNVDPKECLVFEDALSGVRSGKAAGCYVVAIPDPRFSEEEKKVFAKEADMVLDSLWQFDGSKFGLDVDMPKLN